MANDANIIKIKRSGTSGAPSSLKLGELAYSYLAATGNPTGNGGDRLFIGANGTDPGTGNANDIVVIGGKYFTDLLDHTRGTLTASSALIADGNSVIDRILTTGLNIGGTSGAGLDYTISTDNNNNLVLSTGSGKVSINGAYTLPNADGTSGYVLTTNGSGVVSWAAAVASLTVDADTGGTQTVNLLTDTLTTTSADGNIATSVAKNGTTVTTTLDLASDLTGIDSVSSGNSTGAVNINTSPDGSTNYHWQFNTDGTFTLPGTILVPASDSGSISFGNTGTEYGYIKVDNGHNMVVNQDGNFYVKQNGSDRLAITNTTSSLSASTDVTIQSNKTGSAYTWSFNADGTTEFPNYTFTSSAPSNGQALVYDSGTGLVSWSTISSSFYIGTTQITTGNASGDVTALNGINSISSVANTGSVTLNASGGNSWVFGTDGQIVTPDGTHVGTIEGTNTFGFYNSNNSTSFVFETNQYGWTFNADGRTYFPNYSFPSANGTTGQVLIANSSTGELSWGSISSTLYIGTTAFTTGNSSGVDTTIAGLTEIDVGDLILSGNTIENGNNGQGSVQLITNGGGADKTFTFGTDGSLTFPQYADGNPPTAVQYFGMGNLFAETDGNYTVIGTADPATGASNYAGIGIMPGIESQSGVYIPNDTLAGSAALWIANNNSDGRVQVEANQHSWYFNSDGSLTFPSLQQTSTTTQFYGMANLFAITDGYTLIGTADPGTGNIGSNTILISPGIEGSAYLTIPNDTDSAGTATQLVNGNATGQVQIQANTHYWDFNADGTTQFPNYTFPSANASSDGQVLTANATTGILSWTTLSQTFYIGTTEITTGNASGDVTTIAGLTEIDVGDLILSGSTVSTGADTGAVTIVANTGNGDQTWTFNGDGSLNLPTGGDGWGVIQTLDAYPELLAYGSGSHGGPELDWMNTSDTTQFTNSSVRRNTMYINGGGLYIGLNENETSGYGSYGWNFNTDGTTQFPNYKFPAANGQTGQVLTADTSGNLAWTTLSQSFYIGDTQITTGNASGDVTSLNIDITGKATTAGTADQVAHALSNGSNIQSFSFDGSGIATVALATTLTGLVEVDVGDLAISGNQIATQGGTGAVTIEANDGSTNHIWSFGTNGNLELPMGGGTITNVPNPQAPNEVANKAYVDATASGLQINTPVVVATTAPLSTLGGSVSYADGPTPASPSVGATLTFTTPITALDNYTFDGNERILVKDQVNAKQNGVYVYTSSTTWTRAEDFDQPNEITGADFMFVRDGTVNGSTGWVQTNQHITSIGASGSNITFVQFSAANSYIAGDGIGITGNSIAVQLGTNSGLTLSGGSLSVNSGIAGDALSYGSGVLDVQYDNTSIGINVSNQLEIKSTWSGQSAITTVGTISSGTWHGDTLTYAYGGTGQTSYAKGDILYASATNTLSKLAAGTNGQMLQLQDGVPMWADLDGGTY